MKINISFRVTSCSVWGKGGGGVIGLTLTGAAAVFTSSRNTAGIYATRGGIQGDI